MTLKGSLAKLSEAENLTDMQAAFVLGVLNGKSHQQSAEAAGYSQNVPTSVIWGSGAVQRAIKAACDAEMAGELRVEAQKAIRELLTDKTPAATRLQAAKLVMEHGKDASQGDEKPLSEMTPSELEALVRKLEAAKIDRIIDVTPTNGA